MKKRIFAVLMVVSLLTVGGLLSLQPTATEADEKAQFSVSEMFPFAGGGGALVGASRLLRSDGELSMEISTTGLTNGNAYTIWWILFNRPEKCDTPNECGEADVPIPVGGDAEPDHVAEVGFSVVNATGLIVGDDGVGNFSASL